ncbi:hypothetical protein HV201_07015 [Citrobacter freundii]|uniref:hypothetical protein n=1 Tax=Citrobacter freundii TaxID=546 RepID=UPI0015E9C925|nr:hypothetical protein [Citrobacter freundii]QLX04276.1 hypothetical protein HV201_07015 [Citrobacter freundii]
MKIIQHFAKKVTIDGDGGIYIAHHSVPRIVEWHRERGADDEHVAPIAFVGWTMYQVDKPSRLGRFFGLLPIIWKLSK